MEFTKATKEHAEQAARLAYQTYERERTFVPALPDEDFEEKLTGGIRELFEYGYGMVALDKGELKGYLAYWQNIEGFFGCCKGAYSPLQGSAFEGADREKLLSMLFERVAAELSKSGHSSFAMTCYAHDTAARNALTLDGFGIRCSDSVRSLDIPVAYRDDPAIVCREVAKSDMAALTPLHDLLCEHMLASPIFFPTPKDHAEKSFLSDKKRTFAAYRGDQPLGCMQVTDEGENFATEAAGMPNICGMIFGRESRGTGAAAQLLHHVAETMKAEGNTRLGVDCETLNPTALRFWGKYFTPYTYSYHRRIDERALR